MVSSQSKSTKILIVEDEPAIRFGIREFLLSCELAVVEASDCHTAREAFRCGRPDAVLLDHCLPDGNSLDLMAWMKDLAPLMPVIILTGHGSIDLAVRAIKEGAEHFLTKPLELSTLKVLLERVLENERNRRKAMAGQSGRRGAWIDPFVGSSAAIQALKTQALRLLGSESPILIQGETGSGKGVVSAWIHHHGSRRSEAFVELNCAGLMREFLETELFGHEKGAFTGATQSKAGLLEVAHRGTVFLDEIGDMDHSIQAKLLKVIEDKRFRRLGDLRDRQVDIRLIAATHQRLDELVCDGKFRRDLYFRISTLPLVVPPLRERIEDIPLLAERILQDFHVEMGRPGMRLSRSAIAVLQRHPWPGNVRELKNVIERALLVSESDAIGQESLSFDRVTQERSISEEVETLEAVERGHIERVLRAERGHVGRAARTLGISRSSLYERMKKFEIDLARTLT